MSRETTPTENVVAELRGRSAYPGDVNDEAAALIETQRAELAREQTEGARRLACMDRRADRLIELTDALAKAKAEYDKLLSTWAESRERHLAAEARVTALEAEKAGDGWLDISTAPKTGAVIIVCGCSFGPPVRTAYWGAGRYLGRKKGFEQAWVTNPGHSCDPQFWKPMPEPQALSRSTEKNDNSGSSAWAPPVSLTLATSLRSSPAT